jgi:outer membrane murein-binding lipoprotein Lpp
MRFRTSQVAAGLFSLALLAGMGSGCAKKPTPQQEALAARVDAAASKTEAAANKAEAAARSAADAAARAQAAADKAEQMFQGRMRK